jgi:hypothetical protein
MKKLSLFAIIIFAAFSSVSAQTIFTSYSFNVEPKDQGTVLQLYKDYFEKHPNKGTSVSASLYENHFKGEHVATHELVFAGPAELIGAGYDSKSSDSWLLFQSELSKYCKGVSAATGKRISGFGDTSSAIYPVQDVLFAIIKDEDQYKAKFDAFWSKNTAPNTRISFGSVGTRNQDGTTHYIVRSYKDFTTKFTDDIQHAKGYAEMLTSMKDIRTFTTSKTRTLLGKW